MTKKTVNNSLLKNLDFLESSKIGYLNMPPYEQEEFQPAFEVMIELKTEQDAKDFIEILSDDYLPILNESKVTKKYYWYPKLERGEMNSGLKYIWIEDV